MGIGNITNNAWEPCGYLTVFDVLSTFGVKRASLCQPALAVFVPGYVR